METSVSTDGFEFVEYTATDTHALGTLFENMGFAPIARHRSKDVILYRQGKINFIPARRSDTRAGETNRRNALPPIAVAEIGNEPE